jgi:hypothetical protein
LEYLVTGDFTRTKSGPSSRRRVDGKWEWKWETDNEQ